MKKLTKKAMMKATSVASTRVKRGSLLPLPSSIDALVCWAEAPLSRDPAEWHLPKERAKLYNDAVGVLMERWQKKGIVPQHHFARMIDEAIARRKQLTLEHLVFGRDPAVLGVVTVRDGVKVEIRPHDNFAYMTASLTMAGG